MPDVKKNRSDFYQYFKDDIDVKDENEFYKKLDDPENRKQFFNAFKDKIDSEQSDFEANLGYKSKATEYFGNKFNQPVGVLAPKESADANIATTENTVPDTNAPIKTASENTMSAPVINKTEDNNPFEVTDLKDKDPIAIGKEKILNYDVRKSEGYKSNVERTDYDLGVEALSNSTNDARNNVDKVKRRINSLRGRDNAYDDFISDLQAVTVAIDEDPESKDPNTQKLKENYIKEWGDIQQNEFVQKYLFPSFDFLNKIPESLDQIKKETPNYQEYLRKVQTEQAIADNTPFWSKSKIGGIPFGVEKIFKSVIGGTIPGDIAAEGKQYTDWQIFYDIGEKAKQVEELNPDASRFQRNQVEDYVNDKDLGVDLVFGNSQGSLFPKFQYAVDPKTGNKVNLIMDSNVKQKINNYEDKQEFKNRRVLGAIGVQGAKEFVQELPGLVLSIATDGVMSSAFKTLKAAKGTGTAGKLIQKANTILNKPLFNKMTANHVGAFIGEAAGAKIEGSADYREEALKAGLSEDEASLYQMAAGLNNMAQDILVPAEVFAATGMGKSFFKNKLADYAAGKITKTDLLKETGVALLKNITKTTALETAGEAFLEPTILNNIKDGFNEIKGSSFQKEDINKRSIETAFWTSLISTSPFAVPTSIRLSKGGLMSDAIKYAVKNPDVMDSYFKGRRADQGGRALERENFLKGVLDQVKEAGFNEKDQARTATLMIDKQNASLEVEKLSQKYGPDAPLVIKKQKEVTELSKNISDLFDKGTIADGVATTDAASDNGATGAAISKKVFTDFDNTLFDPKTGQLTALGVEMKDRIANGEDVDILTAREDTPENRKLIADKLGIDPAKIQMGLSPEGKAAAISAHEGEKIFYDDNKDNLSAAQGTGAEVVDTGKGEAPQKTKELESLVNQIPTTELRRPNGSIGTQGFTEENLVEVARHIATDMGFDIPAYDDSKGTSEVRQVIEYLRGNKEAQEKIKEYVVKDPVVVSLLPDNTYQVEDGNHRANLLNLIGVDAIPTLELNGRDKETAISEHAKAVEALLDKPKSTKEQSKPTEKPKPTEKEAVDGQNKPVSLPAQKEDGDIERRRQEELKERVVYDRFPTVEDGEFKIIGDPNNRIYRINETTGRPQELDESNGLWSNTALSPNLFMESTKRSGFEKSKNKINAKYNAELKALEQPNSELEAKKDDIERRRQEELDNVQPIYHHTQVKYEDFNFSSFQRGKASISQFGDGLNASTDTTSFLVNRYGKPIQGEVNIKDFIEIDANKSEKELYEYLKAKGYNFSKPASEYKSNEKANEQPAIIELFQDFQKSNPKVKGVKVNNHIIGGQKVSPFYVIYDNKSFYGQDSLKNKINSEYDAELKALEQTTTSNQSKIEAKKADIERRRQEELEKKVQILKDKRNALRGEDGVVPKENIAEWQQLGKDVIEAQNKATRGNNEGFIPIRTEKDGVLSGEDAINAENEIERVIQKIIKGEITIEQAVSFIHNKYKVLANENGFLLNYINDRTSNAPEIGNNKQSFPAWRKGKYDAELAALGSDIEVKKADIERRRQEELETTKNIGEDKLKEGRETTKKIVESLKQRYPATSVKGIIIRILEKLIDFNKYSTIVDSEYINGRNASGQATWFGMMISQETLDGILAGKEHEVHTFIHEFIHGFTTNKISDYSISKQGLIPGFKSNLTQKEINAIEQLQRIFDKVRKDNPNSKEYGFTNLDEFIAEAFSNESFQYTLKNTKAEGKKSNLFTDFINAIGDILFEQLERWAKRHNKEIPNRETITGILEDVLAWTEELIDQNNKLAYIGTNEEINAKYDAEIAALKQSPSGTPAPKPEPKEEKAPDQKQKAKDHKDNIVNKFSEEFGNKGIPKKQIDAALGLMEARAKSWASEKPGRNPDEWYDRIADVKSGEFEKVVKPTEEEKAIVPDLGEVQASGDRISSFNVGDIIERSGKKYKILGNSKGKNEGVVKLESISDNPKENGIVSEFNAENNDGFTKYIQEKPAPKPKSDATLSLEKDLDDAQKELKSAKDKLKAKREKLTKTAQADKEDLFGERKSNDQNKLVDERATGDVEKLLEQEKQDVAAAEKKIDKLKTKLEESKSIEKPTLFDEPVSEANSNIDGIVDEVKNILPPVEKKEVKKEAKPKTPEQPKISPTIEKDSKKNAINKVEDLQDVGEKIGGAKKDLAQMLSEVTTEDLETKPLGKVFPKPDFKKLVEEGSLSEDGAILLNFLYEKIPTKPRKKYRIPSWIKTVQGALDTTMQVLESESTKNLDFTKKILHAVTLSETLKRDYKLYSDTMKGLGFPKEHVNLGGYQIKKFENQSKWNKVTQKLEPVEGTTYSIVSGSSIVGDFKSMDDAINGLKQLLNKSEDKTKGTKFGIYQDRKTKELFIGKKGAFDVVRIMQGFETIKEARDFLKNKQSELQSIWDGMKANPKERRNANRQRVGVDWRKGKNITSDEFAKEFGFRGVEFGNWVNNAERQSHVNEAYEALMDLASVLGVTPKALSLNGELGFAFGARGSGKFNAHYESGKVVINLTKTRGAGSLAHEWWHALDNYFSRNRGQKDSFITERPFDRVNSDGTRNEGVRKEMIDAFKSVMDAIRLSKLEKRSRELDKTRSDAYWSTAIEMSARSFENFIIQKLGERNNQNDYLANFKETSEWISGAGKDMDALKNYPYPLEDESASINEAFQQFFDAIQEKTNAEGKQVLFQKTELISPDDIKETNAVIKSRKIEGGLLTEKQAEDLQKEIESKYNPNGRAIFGQDNEDIRTNAFNYEHPLAQKTINGVDVRISEGLTDGKPYSGNRRTTYLLHADGKLVGKFYSVKDAKDVVDYIEKNLIKSIESTKFQLDAEGNPKGAVETLDDGRKVIVAYPGADFSTMVHELAHIFEGDLTDDELKTIQDIGGSEAFAESFETYIYTGKAPTPKLKTLFNKFKKWLAEVYKSIKGSPIENKITPEVKKIFDRLLTEVNAPPLLSNPINPNKTQSEKADDLRALSEENKVIIDKFLQDVDDQLGTKSGSSFKSKEGIIAKANRPSIQREKPGFDVEHVRDSFRFKTVISSLDQLKDILNLIQDGPFEIVKIDFEKLFNPKEWGWRIPAIDLRMPNGQIVEYYFPIDEIEKAKKNGNHALFEKWRNVDLYSATAKELAKYDKDAKESNKNYQAAWDDYLKREGLSEAALRAKFDQWLKSLSEVDSAAKKLSFKSSADGAPLLQLEPSNTKDKKFSTSPPRTQARPSSVNDTLNSEGTSIPANIQHKSIMQTPEKYNPGFDWYSDEEDLNIDPESLDLGTVESIAEIAHKKKCK